MMNGGWTYRDRVDQDSEGWTVLDYYTQRYRHSSKAEWQTRIEAEQILLGGHPTTAKTRLQRGQSLIYHRPPWQEPKVPLSFEILYEDAEVLAIAKPSGLPVLPGGGFLEHTLWWQLQQRYPQSPPIPIHRLGRGTSGLMLLARSLSARAALSQQLRDRQMHKIYWAIATGISMADAFTVTQPIGKIPHPVLGYIYGATADGAAAHSECRVLRRGRQTALVEVKILTGRSHQIRIHLAAMGHPLLGDPLYGVGGLPLCHSLSEAEMPVPGDCGYWLHALHLAFIHPQSGKALCLTCPPPPDWVEV